MLTTRQADSLRGIYNTILQYHHRQPAGKVAGSVDQSRLVEILQKNPELVNLLEPVLTDEQIDMVLQNATDGANGSA